MDKTLTGAYKSQVPNCKFPNSEENSLTRQYYKTNNENAVAGTIMRKNKF